MKKLPAWIRGSNPTQLEGGQVNSEGLTFDEWVAAATGGRRISIAEETIYMPAWRRGEDPTEWRARDGKPARGFKMDDDLEGLAGDDRPFYHEVVSDDWDESARKLIETINGVGHFYYGSLEDALEAGPYENSQEFVLDHLHWLKWWYEVYEGSKIDRVFERRFR